MKPRIPRNHLLAFARECLKLEKLLSEADDLAEIGRLLNLVRALEKSGGSAALEALLCPEQSATGDLSGTAASLQDSLNPIPATSTRAPRAKEAL
jgi:hypothetical protein